MEVNTNIVIEQWTRSIHRIAQADAHGSAACPRVESAIETRNLLEGIFPALQTICLWYDPTSESFFVDVSPTEHTEHKTSASAIARATTVARSRLQ